MIYFDNGATTYPKPRAVVRAVEEAMTRYGANPGRSGHEMSMKTAVKVYEARASVAKLFHVENPEEVVFTGNCTHAINLAVKGALRPGDHVVISDLEHNAVLRPVYTLSQRGAVTYSVAETFSDPEETVASFARRIRPNTRMIACIHGSNAFGFRLPAERLGRLCREYGLLFLLDAAQTAGLLDIDAPGMGIDFLCAPGHKGLYGPAGTGVLVTPHGSELDTIIEGGTGSYSSQYRQPQDMPDHLESGTVNTPGIIGLGAGVNFVRETGREKIHRHEMRLAAEITARLRQIDRVILYSPDINPETQLPVIAFNLEGMTSEELTGRLSEMGFALRGGLHCAPLAHKKMGTLESGAARISIGAFNTSEQAAALCDAIKKCSRRSCNDAGMW